MKQREITDNENTTWQCVQAYAGLDSKTAEKAAELAEENGTVTVVCTPSGGAQTVRLNLPVNWFEELSDEQLADLVQKERK